MTLRSFTLAFEDYPAEDTLTFTSEGGEAMLQRLDSPATDGAARSRDDRANGVGAFDKNSTGTVFRVLHYGASIGISGAGRRSIAAISAAGWRSATPVSGAGGPIGASVIGMSGLSTSPSVDAAASAGASLGSGMSALGAGSTSGSSGTGAGSVAG
jgi:hypothetical protein